MQYADLILVLLPGRADTCATLIISELHIKYMSSLKRQTGLEVSFLLFEQGIG